MVRAVEYSFNQAVKTSINLELQLANALLHHADVEIYNLLLKGAEPLKLISLAKKSDKTAYDIAISLKNWRFVAHILIQEIAKNNSAKVKELFAKVAENINQVIDQPGYISQYITPRTTLPKPNLVGAF